MPIAFSCQSKRVFKLFIYLKKQESFIKPQKHFILQFIVNQHICSYVVKYENCNLRVTKDVGQINQYLIVPQSCTKVLK